MTSYKESNANRYCNACTGYHSDPESCPVVVATKNANEQRINARLGAAWTDLGAAIEEWRQFLNPTDAEMDEASKAVYEQYADMKASEHVGSVDWDTNVLEYIAEMRKEKENPDGK